MEIERLRAQTCRIATRGRRTGDEHVVQVWFVTIGTTFYAPSRHGLEGDWLRNALHHGSLEVRAGRDSWHGPASLVPPEEVERVVDAFASKYHRYASTIAPWRRHPPTFVQVDLAPGPTAVAGP